MRVSGCAIPMVFSCDIDPYIPLAIRAEMTSVSERRRYLRLVDNNGFVELAKGSETGLLRDFTIVCADRVRLGEVRIDANIERQQGVPVFATDCLTEEYCQLDCPFEVVVDKDKLLWSVLGDQPLVYYEWEQCLFGISPDQKLCQVLTVDLTDEQVDDIKWKFKVLPTEKPSVVKGLQRKIELFLKKG